ncbi:Brix domain-containing protein [Ochromonadaceae sp. CCMP2298]|nr:Brix domain-containing protein [Ochromonadaceae sp. CCMP2298]
MPKKGGKRTKSRTHETGPPVGVNAPADSKLGEERDVPRSIVAKVGRVSPVVGELVRDLRKLMGPYTADKLREKNYNRMKDYAGVAGHIGVTHLLIVSQTKHNIVMRMGRVPDGPTLHFRVCQYSLARQVRLTQKRPYESSVAFTHT